MVCIQRQTLEVSFIDALTVTECSSISIGVGGGNNSSSNNNNKHRKNNNNNDHIQNNGCYKSFGFDSNNEN